MRECKRGDLRIMRVTEIDGERATLVDAGGIVRCRDCIYWRDEDFCSNPQWLAGRPYNGLMSFPCTFPESFCSYAEKREEAR